MFNRIFKEKRERRVKVRSQYYINSQREPNDNVSHDTLPRNEAVLLEKSPNMRGRFRNIAQKIRLIRLSAIKQKTKN
ncbi:MAG TPA: hypothetical protein VIH90_02085 [Candidatus Saccharimonadales bacterium]